MSSGFGKMSNGEIDSASELHSVIMDSLKRRGVIGKVSANVRAEVFHTLEDKTVNAR